MGLLEFLPVSWVRFFIDYAPFKSLRNGRRVARLATGIAKELVDEKAEALLAGKSKRDIMSLLGAPQFLGLWHLANSHLFSQGQRIRK
jgi:hypothetical protein